MDVQQLTVPSAGRGSWSLRTDLDAAESGPLAGLAPWWLDKPPAVVHDPAEGIESRGAGRGAAVVATIAALTALAVCAIATIALLSGMRWFVVETPSMGTAAPVGALVITAPTPAELQRGEIIAFTPPGTPRVYTHRVYSVASDGSVRTKGDINGAPDGWTIERTKVLGRAVSIVPGAGYVVRGLPALLAGATIVWALTMLIRRRARRSSARIIGLHLVATAVLLWLHPFVRVVLIDASGSQASVVSTGLLPVKLMDAAGSVLARLTVGSPELVTLPTASDAASRVVAVPDLTWLLQLGLVGLALIPALVVLAVGLPRDPEVTA